MSIWQDFAALVKGHQPTRREGQAFRYLELVSEMGLHLCLLASAYPKGQFVGVDFHVDQIAHSLQLQQQLGLANVTFIHADFLTLSDPSNVVSVPNAEILVPRSFHYVACHGVFTWVQASVQAALPDLTSRCLAIARCDLPPPRRGRANAQRQHVSPSTPIAVPPVSSAP